MRRLFSCFLLTTLLGSFAPGHAQELARIDSMIGHVVTCSFRISTDSKIILDSLLPYIHAAKNERLTAYYEAYKNGWVAYHSTLPDVQKQQAKRDIERMAEASRYKDLRAHMLFWMGTHNLFKANENETKGLTQTLLGKKLLEEVNYEKLPYAIEYYKSLADIYSYFGDYRACIEYTERAAAEPPSSFWGRQTLYNDLGTYYMRLNQYEKAEAAFKKGVLAAKNLNQSAFALMVQANRGNLRRLQGRYQEALPLLYPHAILNESAIPEDAALCRLYIAGCLLHLDSLQKAATFLRRPHFPIPHWTQPTYDLTWYDMQALYHQKSGNLALALTYKDSIMFLKDSIRAVRDTKKIMVLESSLRAERFTAERAALEAGRHWRNVVIVLLTTASIVVVFLLLLRRRAEQKSEAQKRLRTEEALTHANERLHQYLASLREKNALIEQIRLQLDEATVTSNRLAETEKAQYLQNLQKSVLFTEPDWERFKMLFEQVFPGFFSHLLQQYPELTPAEIRLLALEELKLSDKEKGAMLNISADSIKKARYRLRKKYPNVLAESSQQALL